jgi:hypothetical protein
MNIDDQAVAETTEDLVVKEPYKDLDELPLIEQPKKKFFKLADNFLRAYGLEMKPESFLRLLVVVSIIWTGPDNVMDGFIITMNRYGLEQHSPDDPDSISAESY